MSVCGNKELERTEEKLDILDLIRMVTLLDQRFYKYAKITQLSILACTVHLAIRA